MNTGTSNSTSSNWFSYYNPYWPEVIYLPEVTYWPVHPSYPFIVTPAVKKEPFLCPKCKGEKEMEGCRVCKSSGVIWG